MRISTCTYPVRDKDAETALRIMANAGFKKVDLWGRMPHFSTNPAEMDPAKLMQTAQRIGVKIANLGTYPGQNFSSANEAEREAALREMKATIDLAAKLGARSIRVMPGKGEDAAVVTAIVPYFKESAKYAQAKNVYMGMENHKGSIAGNPDLCVELCKKVNSPYFGVLYEPCNLLHGGVDYKAAFRKFAPYITHLHLKDGAVREGKFARTMLGEGDVDVRWVVDNMNSIGYEGDFALEYEICDLVPIETGLPKWMEYFRNF
jgi:sugar phosphate isomerase/epimerase